MSEKALIIEDDADLVVSLRELVDNLGYQSEVADNGKSGLELAQSQSYAFILLDINLPRMDGTEVCRLIREQDKQTPIVVLTSNKDETHTVLLLELGADDYITKPFRVLELKARIKSALRRVSPQEQAHSTVQELRCAALRIDLEKRRVFKNDEPVALTALEFDILIRLARSPGKPLSRDALIEEFYGGYSSSYDKGFSTHIARLRAKIEDNPSEPRYIMTARGVGYYFSDEKNGEG